MNHNNGPVNKWTLLLLITIIITSLFVLYKARDPVELANDNENEINCYNFICQARQKDIEIKPFPFLVIKNAIPQKKYQKLDEAFPNLEEVLHGQKFVSNERFNLPSETLLYSKSIASIWREIIRNHTTIDFFKDWLSLFLPSIKFYYPTLYEKFINLGDKLRVGVRGVDTFENSDFLIDVQLSINTPVTDHASSVRLAHLDAPSKLLVGLFYMRRNDDDSTGGGLEIYRRTPKGEQGLEKDSRIQLIDKIPYMQNCFVTFLNTIDSLHGVEERSPTQIPRRFVNIIVNLDSILFKPSEFQENYSEAKIIKGEDIKKEANRAAKKNSNLQ
eukprot:TRINITY_DN7596_c0_g1_i1.p1 TRINITY_DN7596_c0_g1~~TRINITY_DN7596_c0_g1_i1.p1  ORF type:complete len:330 (-),score=153.41 TRINITY_DN7596_c0_g1_i1:31-1020(-)